MSEGQRTAVTSRTHPSDQDVQALKDTLSEERWLRVNRRLLTKMLEEFMYEDLIEPQVGETDGDWTQYRLEFTDSRYRYRGQPRVFDSYRVAEESVERQTETGDWEPARDTVQFVLDARETIGIDDETASHLVREYTNTLLADAHILARKEDRTKSILDMSYAEVEGAMEGHPWFTVNKGRIGFGYDDYRRYTPEQQTPQSLQWVAVRRTEATFRSATGYDYDSLVTSHLGDHVDTFHQMLAEDGLDPTSYYLLPVHKWQWQNTLAQLFAPDIATDDIVPLGSGPDTYRPQQSIRTLTNRDDPTKPHVKVPIRILNTLVYRGLPGEQALAAPRVTDCITQLRDEDPFLSDSCDLVLPGEIASLNYDHDAFSQLSGAPYQYHELLGAVWRESLETLAEDDEAFLPLAALIHRDTDGSPVVSKLADRAGCSLETWLEEFLGTFFPPLLHYLYRYGLVFMPHGTNVILLLEDGRPSRIAVKDYVDEIAVSDRRLPESDVIPDDIYDHDVIFQQKGPEELCQHIFGTVFICVFRYMSDLLERHEDLDEEVFWRQVRDSIERYQASHPDLTERFEYFDLFKPEFTRLCLNRGRLTDRGYADDASEPTVTAHGTVTNTLATLDD